MKTIEELRAAVIVAAKRQLEALEQTDDSTESLWLMSICELESAVRALRAAEAEGDKQ